MRITDYGRSEYLDGACMQYTIQQGKKYPNGDTRAYCDDARDAVLFAMSRKMHRVLTALNTTVKKGVPPDMQKVASILAEIRQMLKKIKG